MAKRRDPRQALARERWKAYMTRENVTDKAFAGRAGLTTQAVSRFRNDRDMEPENLAKLAAAMGLGVDELLSDPPADAEPGPPGRVLTREQERLIDVAEIVGYAVAIETLKEKARVLQMGPATPTVINTPRDEGSRGKKKKGGA